MLKPEFSIIIPTYNRSLTIARSLDSVLNQVYKAKEIIVVDDGSTDDTVELVKKYDSAIYRFQYNQGVCSARNLGAEVASGDWLVFLDSDDELHPFALKEFAKNITNNLVLKSGFVLVKDDKEELFLPSINKYVGHIPGSFAISKILFQRIGGYDLNLKFAENTELFFRIEFLGVNPFIVPFATLRYYQSSSGSNNNLEEMTKSIIYILKKHPNLDKKIKRFYHQILGVNYLRFSRFKEARSEFICALLINPFIFINIIRLCISFSPKLASLIYPLKPRSY